MMGRIVRGILAAVLVMLLFAIPTFALLLKAFAEEAGVNHSVFTVLVLSGIVGVVALLRRLWQQGSSGG